jgi:hypothetical protein
MSDDTHKYLGDGVYASYDGHHVWLAVTTHENKVVALEPLVLLAVVRYAFGYLDPGALADASRGMADSFDPPKDAS